MNDSLPWSTEPNVSGLHLCLRDGVFTLYNVEYDRDPQTGIARWEATEMCTGNRTSWSAASLRPAAHWLLVTALPLSAGEGELTSTNHLTNDE